MLQKRVEAVTFLVNSDEKLSITDASTGNSVQAQLIPPVPVPFDLGTADVRPDQQWSIVAMVTIPPLTKSVLRFSASNGTTTTSSSWSCVNASAAAVHRDELTISGNGVELSFDAGTLLLDGARSSNTTSFEKLSQQYHSDIAVSNAYQFQPSRHLSVIFEVFLW
eukprot:INCI8253.1.p3 GENE.INCI8253.1~~INCI8253.1.p3  ORF type:complete len:165 (+),score=33.29 INCI8253.1:2146-2640(+)